MLMLDFETLGSGADTIVVSLGAVGFNKNGIVGEALFEYDLLDQQKAGRTFTASTLQWWMEQKDQARAVFKQNDRKLTLEKFFENFERAVSNWAAKVGENWDEVKPWGNGANFDVSILEDIYRRHHSRRDQGIPWKFWNVCCFRTFNMLTDCKRYAARPHGTHHSALDDARYQANCVLAYWKAKQLKKEGKSK